MGSWNTIEIDKDGRKYAGKYRVEGGIMTVTYDAEGGGDKSAKVGSSDQARLARELLSQVVTELRSNRT